MHCAAGAVQCLQLQLQRHEQPALAAFCMHGAAGQLRGDTARRSRSRGRQRPRVPHVHWRWCVPQRHGLDSGRDSAGCVEREQDSERAVARARVPLPRGAFPASRLHAAPSQPICSAASV
jgi:hypothetical protein